MNTFYRWMLSHAELRELYARAKESQLQAIEDDMLDIADDGSNDWMERKSKDGDNIGWIENGEAVRRSALRLDTRKWLLAKLMPKKYGERIQQDVNISGSLAQDVNEARKRIE